MEIKDVYYTTQAAAANGGLVATITATTVNGKSYNLRHPEGLDWLEFNSIYSVSRFVDKIREAGKINLKHWIPNT